MIEPLYISETITGINPNSEVKYLKVFEPTCIIRLTAQVHVSVCRITEVLSFNVIICIFYFTPNGTSNYSRNSPPLKSTVLENVPLTQSRAISEIRQCHGLYQENTKKSWVNVSIWTAQTAPTPCIAFALSVGFLTNSWFTYMETCTHNVTDFLQS